MPAIKDLALKQRHRRLHADKPDAVFWVTSNVAVAVLELRAVADKAALSFDVLPFEAFAFFFAVSAGCLPMPLYLVGFSVYVWNSRIKPLKRFSY